MIVAEILKNRIPGLLAERDWSISDLQRRSGLSYPATLRLAKDTHIGDAIQIGTLRRIAAALGVSIGDLMVVEEN